MISNISAVMITKNSEKHIKESLESLKDFEEIIIYDNGSCDNTLKIAKQFKNVKIIKGEFYGFGKTKNLAADYAKNDWIFSIDSDEIATEQLIKEIKNISLENHTVYAINRKNLFLGKAVKHSGWNPDWIKRLYNKKFTKFSDVEVHESIISSKVVKLKGRLIHYAVDNTQDTLIKMARYSTMKRKKNYIINPYFALLRASFAFFRTYFVQLGFLDGYAGLIISINRFIGVFHKGCYWYYNKDKL